ncbi:MAG: hypothetical protein JSV84_13520 [Gemmatimonadota bacterium]|nr:MAG: hypothetical protein JSV84_13520 [Gemmatimonadota bacterium]
MKHWIYIFTIVILWNVVVQVHGALLLEDATDTPEDSASSFLGGVYGTYPILNESELKEWQEKNDRIEQALKRHQAERTQYLDSLNTLMRSDTVSVRRHSTFLGGLFTLPKLSDREKEAKSLRKKIAAVQSKIEKLNEKIPEMKLELRALKELKRKHEQYLEKRILWGFLSWEVKKKSDR